jgi:hypothetical protein
MFKQLCSENCCCKNDVCYKQNRYNVQYQLLKYSYQLYQQYNYIIVLFKTLLSLLSNNKIVVLVFDNNLLKKIEVALFVNVFAIQTHLGSRVRANYSQSHIYNPHMSTVPVCSWRQTR